jgi:hypothetical protein
VQPMEHRVDSRNLYSETRYEELGKTIYPPEREDKAFHHFLSMDKEGSRFDLSKKYWETLIISM